MKDVTRILLSSLLLMPLGSSFSAVAASFSATPVADVFVATGPTGNLSDNNYGGGGALAIAAPGLTNGEFQTVIRFDLSGVRSSLDAVYGPGQWTVGSAALQLSSSAHNNAIYNDIVPGLFSASLMQDTSWTEGTGNASNPATNGITYNSLQSTYVGPADQNLGTFSFPGGSAGANTYNLNLSPGLAADILAGNVASLRLFAADNNISYLFSSRAMSLANQPTLIITAVPEPASIALLSFAFVLFKARACRRLR